MLPTDSVTADIVHLTSVCIITTPPTTTTIIILIRRRRIIIIALTNRYLH